MATLIEHLRVLYPGHDSGALASRVRLAMGLEPVAESTSPAPPSWSQEDVVLITYADTVRASGEKPLHTLGRFLDSALADIVSVVHVLPFFPSSSDGGFSVVDFETVDPAFGDWAAIEALNSGGRRVMADLVLNHVSASSAWFQQFVAGELPGRDYFVTADPSDDLSQVVRPRAHPLLYPVETVNGTQHVWATFSHDQIDVDFANPDVLIEFVRFIDLFVSKGVSVLRLDAIGYLWKRLGTPSIHLEETHRVVKILRQLLDERAPGAVLITETNVPHVENVSYFGEPGPGEDEAHLVYNFTLAPLVFHSLLHGSAATLTRWAGDLEPRRPGTSFFNFLASHDGIGVRPVEGLLTSDQIDDLASAVERHGGQVSHYATNEGLRPYELNTSLFAGLATTADGAESDLHIERFCAAHGIMLSFVGVPAFYIHSLLATPNDFDAIAATGHNRDINRSKLELAAVEEALAEPETSARLVLDRLTHLTTLRRQIEAFHPEAAQTVLDVGPQVFAVRRTPSVGSPVEAYINVSATPAVVPVAGAWHNLVDGSTGGELLELEPYGVAWLVAEDAARS